MNSSKAEKTAHILHVLQTLPWARIDCSWRDITLKVFAHNQIQATRAWLNREGKPTCQHIARRFVELEQRLAECDQSYQCGVMQQRPSSDEL